jgi:hypothetical protein
MRYFTVEVLEKANLIENEQERVEFLKKYINQRPVQIALASFHNPNIQFFKHRGQFEYVNKFPTLGLSDNNYENISKKMYLFLESTDIPLEKKEKQFVNFLESVSQKEAELLVNMVKKNNPYKNLNKNFIKKHFNNILDVEITR